ncbi:molybdopterin-dependent oxidoreductase [Brachybacterium saurashtrense]|uniref:Oxidoreductase n=1 Tax=Brachybacterium saurashtrense TaxID=556288 RepID=A0A345YRR5_9MICO|nr:molybdopterin-dependent oxidoreductase [Brachybacterium saurashtrense]AXK46617.1 oxidoreductase [Brachybacterium saurashtrense]RRR20755.1 oxidoreductase [Brachybacterium saurashtrense]RRR24358.1 oxidoreductase [Brachybacterium saurashtrense]
MTAPRGAARWSAVAGVVAGLVLVAVAELASLAFSSSSAPFVAVGGAFVDIVPPGVKDLVIRLFGTWDKLVLFASMGAVYLVLTALIGRLGAARRALAAVLLAGLGALAMALVLTRAQNTALDVLPTLFGTLVAVPALLLLLRTVHGPAASGTEGAPGADGVGAAEGTGTADGAGAADGAGTTGSADEARARWTRRRALLGVGAVGVLAVVGAAVGRGITASREVAARAARYVLPAPRTSAPPIPAEAQVELEGMPRYLTPNQDFYRIDTALAVPRVDPAAWSLRIHGLVDQELEIDLAALLEEPMVEAHVTLTCVSNAVGGDLAGNATWLGVPVRTLLERAGVQDGADMVLSRSIDGFTASTPLEALTDDRDSLIAVGMNGEPLPAEHGYPVRMVVPGLYGYVSATKWLTELKVTRFEDDVAYWSTRGWSERGPIKTASRVDVPRSFAELEADADGAVMLGGTAWAQQRGVSAVEVRIDDGQWREAQLGAEVTADTWVQWSLRWGDAEPGDHSVTVRATDGEGTLQTSQRAAPAPDGASGWHTVRFTVV